MSKAELSLERDVYPSMQEWGHHDDAPNLVKNHNLALLEYLDRQQYKSYKIYSVSFIVAVCLIRVAGILF